MTSKLYDVDMAKERLTVYLSPEVARVLRVSAARRGIKDSEAVEEAIKEHLGLAALERAAERNLDLTEDEAMELAVREQHAARRAPQGVVVLRAVVDVNVFISAHLNASGPPARVYRAWLDGAFELVASPRLIDELDQVAARPRIARRLDPLAIPVLVARLHRDAVIVDDPPPVRVVRRDPKDDYLVALARAGGAHAIVTGDRHLLDMEDLRPRALTPRAFLDWVDKLG